jgi:hypothetical protein
MVDAVRVCSRCDTVCMPYNTRCSRCDADLTSAPLVSLRELVQSRATHSSERRSRTPGR